MQDATGAVGADGIKELRSVQRSYHANPEQMPLLERYGRDLRTGRCTSCLSHQQVA